MRSWPVPTSALPRDACMCLGLRAEKRYKHAPDPLCSACRAWEEGYVLVEGKRHYLRAAWVNVNTSEQLRGTGWQ